ncbi:hypothetical protein [Aquirufa ecclesiirivi]
MSKIFFEEVNIYPVSKKWEDSMYGNYCNP